MSLECVYCGSKDNLQTHHWAYGDKELEEKWCVIVCVQCHQKIHRGHGVGHGKGSDIFDKVKMFFIELHSRFQKRSDIAGELDISYMTAYLWDRRLGWPKYTGREESSKRIYPIHKVSHRVFPVGKDKRRFRRVNIKIEDPLRVIGEGQVTLPQKWRDENNVVPGDVLQNITIEKIVRRKREKKG